MKKNDIFDLLRSLEKTSKKIQSVFEDSDILDGEISMVWEIIEESYGIHGNDDATDILYKFGTGKISKEKAKRLLKKLNEEA